MGKRTGCYRRGNRHWKSKIAEKDVVEIRQLYATGDYIQQELADKYNISRTQIAKICNRTSWSHVA